MLITKKVYLSHVVLYSKGWYIKTEDIVEDLIKVLKFDDYTPFTKEDVVSILLRAYQTCFTINLLEFISDINPYNCWKVGYYFKDSQIKEKENLPEYDMYTAVIYKILSDFRQLDNNQWNIKVPKYFKGFKRPENISLQRLIEVFNFNLKNKITQHNT